jgi:hypothetical protein
MAKLWRAGELLVFECPGCQYGHNIPVEGPRAWKWNGSMDKPTFYPSIKIDIPGGCCHSWVKDGQIQFLADCDHKLRGQTVDLPEVEH